MSQEARVRIVVGDRGVNSALRESGLGVVSYGTTEHIRLSFEPEIIVTRFLIEKTMAAIIEMSANTSVEIISYEIEEPV